MSAREQDWIAQMLEANRTLKAGPARRFPIPAVRQLIPRHQVRDEVHRQSFDVRDELAKLF